MELNLSQLARPALKVTLPDEEGTVVHVLAPVKYRAEKLIVDYADLIAGNGSGDRATEFARSLLSNNREGRIFDEQYFEKYIAADDVAVFLDAFGRFVRGLETEKN